MVADALRTASKSAVAFFGLSVGCRLDYQAHLSHHGIFTMGDALRLVLISWLLCLAPVGAMRSAPPPTFACHLARSEETYSHVSNAVMCVRMCFLFRYVHSQELTH